MVVSTQSPQADNDALFWFAVRVKSRFEKCVASSLRGKEYEVLLPLYKANPASDRAGRNQNPIFPGYVFCRLHPQNRLPILTTPGVLLILGNRTELTAISNHEITSLQAIERSGLPTAPHQFLNVGAEVEIRRGPLAGIRGFVVVQPNQSRIVVSVSLLMRSLSVKLDRSWVQPLEPAQSATVRQLEPTTFQEMENGSVV